MFVCRKLIVDEFHELFDANGMKFREFKSEYSQVREYAAAILRDCPEKFLDDRILEQQLSEIIKNAIKHGNKQDPQKHLRVWFDFRHRVRFIVEDEGEGFNELDNWNAFYYRRQKALYDQDFDTFLELASYRGKSSTPEDGGNSLIAALEYWNGGMVYNEKKNKVGVVRWYTHGFEE
jgi:serine/threonine-protein kinase RsbW